MPYYNYLDVLLAIKLPVNYLWSLTLSTTVIISLSKSSFNFLAPIESRGIICRDIGQFPAYAHADPF